MEYLEGSSWYQRPRCHSFPPWAQGLEWSPGKPGEPHLLAPSVGVRPWRSVDAGRPEPRGDDRWPTTKEEQEERRGEAETRDETTQQSIDNQPLKAPRLDRCEP